MIIPLSHWTESVRRLGEAFGSEEHFAFKGISNPNLNVVYRKMTSFDAGTLSIRRSSVTSKLKKMTDRFSASSVSVINSLRSIRACIFESQPQFCFRNVRVSVSDGLHRGPGS